MIAVQTDMGDSGVLLRIVNSEPPLTIDELRKIDEERNLLCEGVGECLDVKLAKKGI